jgi:hypothetical protein
MAPRMLGNIPEPGPQKGMGTVDTAESSVFRPREASEDHHPHACTDGLVFLTYTVFDEAVGEEVECLEVVPCRRCADSR